MYKLFRNILFLFDAEDVHYFAMNVMRSVCRIGFFKKIIEKKYQPKNITTNSLGLIFKNPVGLAAGFDKNAKYLSELETLGFGFIEIGTVTPLAQSGNERPRLFRLPKDKALINRMGFNNEGVKVVADRIKEWRHQQLTTDNQRILIGGNIGKNKVTPNEDAWKDYEICFRELFDWVDYFVVNVSSPNTPGLRELQQKDSLRKILTALQSIRQENLRDPPQKAKPLLLKISPDLSMPEVDDIIDLALEIKLDGIIAANTTISRENLSTGKTTLNKIGAGGLSGKPLQKASVNIVQYITKKTNGNLLVIASGGIFNSADANKQINAGASLLQVWTGFIYEGPSIIKNICSNLSYLHRKFN
jgi:dihydroorotate dehydrogenase